MEKFPSTSSAASEAILDLVFGSQPGIDWNDWPANKRLGRDPGKYHDEVRLELIVTDEIPVNWDEEAYERTA